MALAFFAPYLRLRFVGTRGLPSRGAVVIAPNHLTDVDPIVVGLAVWKAGRVPRFLAKASLFRVPVFGILMRSLGHIPVERASRRGPDPLAVAGAQVAEGRAVIVYPEGTLTREPDLWPMRGKTGAVRIALASGAPIVPMAHWGAHRILPRWSRRLRPLPRHTVEIVFGEPIDLAPWRARAKDPAALAEATEYVMAAITALEEGLRGQTAPPERYDPVAHGQSEFGRP
ncbi:MAG: 1-acyl-sn-glycerol-3-phosphate acyltransferase [Micrococcales bacterium]|nr:1-acyl-sn-glycerol-3-phosphate acyltransferase [Micrococcales bacterium]